MYLETNLTVQYVGYHHDWNDDSCRSKDLPPGQIFRARKYTTTNHILLLPYVIILSSPPPPPPPLSLLNDQREKDPRATLSKIIHTPSHALTHSLFRSLSVRLLLQQAGIGSRRKGGDARLAYPDIAIPTYPPA